MGLSTYFRIYVGTTLPADEFEERFGIDPLRVEAKQDGDLCATKGFELRHDEVVIGIPIAKFSSQTQDLQALHSLDLRTKFEDVVPEARKQLQDFGIDGYVSIYTVTEVL